MPKALLLFALILVPVAGNCDTIKLKEGEQLNGKITYSGGEFVIVARFEGGKKETARILRQKVESVEINRNELNSGAPPDWLHGRDERKPPVDIKPKVPQPPDIFKLPDTTSSPGVVNDKSARKDVLRLTDGEKKIGRLVEINADAVILAIGKKKTEKFFREAIHSILLDAARE